jgi:uncharacterized protein YozE (UPF0346 family)
LNNFAINICKETDDTHNKYFDTHDKNSKIIYQHLEQNLDYIYQMAFFYEKPELIYQNKAEHYG